MIIDGTTERAAGSIRTDMLKSKSTVGNDKLRKAVEGFESYIWGTVLGSMQNSIQKSGLFGSGTHEKMFNSMLMHEFSKGMSGSMKGGSLSDIMMNQLSGNSSRVRPDANIGLNIAKQNKIEGNADIDQVLTNTKEKETLLAEAKPNLSKYFGTPSISSGYGWRVDPIDGSKKFHKGLDIATPMETEIKAPVDGTVSYAGTAGGYGNTVILRTKDNIELRFAHLSSMNCKVGDKISAGETLCLSGSSGRSTGPHVHFEVRNGNDETMDPLFFIASLKKDSRFADFLP